MSGVSARSSSAAARLRRIAALCASRALSALWYAGACACATRSGGAARHGCSSSHAAHASAVVPSRVKPSPIVSEASRDGRRSDITAAPSSTTAPSSCTASRPHSRSKMKGSFTRATIVLPNAVAHRETQHIEQTARASFNTAVAFAGVSPSLPR
eukprot:6190139-Pleurochrysis_carterae.AAC.3